MDLDEHEQGERVQRWLRQNGSSLVTGILLGLALVFGWQWWQGQGGKHQAEAANQYLAYGKAVAAKDAAKAKALETQLAGEYEDTSYARLAVLRQAAYLQSQDKTAEAIALLEKAQPRFAGGEYDELLQLRLARLQLIAGKPALAAARLDAIKSPQYPAQLAELRGDVASAQGKRDDARKAYAQALTHLDQGAPTRTLLEIKLIDAGGEPPAKPEA